MGGCHELSDTRREAEALALSTGRYARKLWYAYKGSCRTTSQQKEAKVHMSTTRKGRRALCTAYLWVILCLVDDAWVNVLECFEVKPTQGAGTPHGTQLLHRHLGGAYEMLGRGDGRGGKTWKPHKQGEREGGKGFECKLHFAKLITQLCMPSVSPCLC